MLLELGSARVCMCPWQGWAHTTPVCTGMYVHAHSGWLVHTLGLRETLTFKGTIFFFFLIMILTLNPKPKQT